MLINNQIYILLKEPPTWLILNFQSKFIVLNKFERIKKKRQTKNKLFSFFNLRKQVISKIFEKINRSTSLIRLIVHKFFDVLKKNVTKKIHRLNSSMFRRKKLQKKIHRLNSSMSWRKKLHKKIRRLNFSMFWRKKLQKKIRRLHSSMFWKKNHKKKLIVSSNASYVEKK